MRTVDGGTGRKSILKRQDELKEIRFYIAARGGSDNVFVSRIII